MKNVKNIFAMVALVTVMGVSSSFGGVYLSDRSANGQMQATCENQGGIMEAVVDNTGIIIAGLTGIIIAGRDGIIIAGKGDVQEQPCTTDGNSSSLDGIIIAG